jgi:hypothetical protein
MIRFAIWPTMIWFAFGASASTAKPPKAVKRKPAGEAYEMRVSVLFGERSTQFFVTSSGNVAGSGSPMKEGVKAKRNWTNPKSNYYFKRIRNCPPATIFRTVVIDREWTS